MKAVITLVCFLDIETFNNNRAIGAIISIGAAYAVMDPSKGLAARFEPLPCDFSSLVK